MVRDMRFAGSTDKDDDEVKLSCPHCNGLLVGPDSSYKNCQNCGRTGIPVYQGRKESELDSFVEASDSPFSDGGYAISLADDRLKGRRREIKERSMDWRPSDDDE